MHRRLSTPWQCSGLRFYFRPSNFFSRGKAIVEGPFLRKPLGHFSRAAIEKLGEGLGEQLPARLLPLPLVKLLLLAAVRDAAAAPFAHTVPKRRLECHLRVIIGLLEK